MNYTEIEPKITEPTLDITDLPVGAEKLRKRVIAEESGALVTRANMSVITDEARLRQVFELAARADLLMDVVSLDPPQFPKVGVVLRARPTPGLN
jgi:hypothetical protein